VTEKARSLTVDSRMRLTICDDGYCTNYGAEQKVENRWSVGRPANTFRHPALLIYRRLSSLPLIKYFAFQLLRVSE